MSTKHLPLLLGAAFLLAVPTATAQFCALGDDGFQFGCCQPPAPLLPSFPPIQITGSYACISSCGATNPLTAVVLLSAPTYFLCDYAWASVTAALPTGESIAGVILMKYSRTWTEPVAGAVQRQVWRFLVNGDLRVTGTPSSLGLCPLPPCGLAPLNLPVHWVGHVDYSCHPTSPGLDVAFSLSHFIGCISHAPFAVRPLGGAAGHQNTSYHLVGPAPFNFGPISEPQGPLMGDAVRSSTLDWNPFTYLCHGEARVTAGQLTTLSSGCLCSSLPSVGPYKHQTLSGNACCIGIVPFNGIPAPGAPFPTGFLAQTLGTFVGPPTGFPGVRDLTIYIGLLRYPDPCNPSAFPYHFVTGVATSRVLGQMLVPTFGICAITSSPLSMAFIDLQNMLDLSTPVASISGFGSLFASTTVWNLNTP